MAKLQIPGSVKRFGTRYGKTVKMKVAFIEKEQRAFHKCPDCHADKVRRIAAGIWLCSRCSKKFAGKAYSPGKKSRLVESVEEGDMTPILPRKSVQKETTEEAISEE